MPACKANKGISHEKFMVNSIETGLALFAQRNWGELLDRALESALDLTGAAVGAIFLAEDDLLKPATLIDAAAGIHQGGASGRTLDAIKPAPLEAGNPVSHAALYGKTVHVADVYVNEDFNFSGLHDYDGRTGRRSGALLAIPMRAPEGPVVGALALLAARVPGGGPGVFPSDAIEAAQLLSEVAAPAIVNAQLLEDTQALFHSLVEVMATALDRKSPYSGNHIQRVAKLNAFIAETVNAKTDGPFADVNFSPDEIESIRLAGWLHDVGKIVTPESVMDKATKLETRFDRIEHIRLRFDLIRKTFEAEALEAKIEALNGRKNSHALNDIDETLRMRLAEVADELDFIEHCNRPGEVLEDKHIEKLNRIAAKTYETDAGEQTYLTSDELAQLSIRKGSLSEEELQIMRDHVLMTRRMLARIPFTGPLKDVPLIAGQHHEKIDGSGYPDGLRGPEIPLPSRILAISDFYEALSAKDRPYKKPLPESIILRILDGAARAGEIDADLLKLFTGDMIHRQFEAQYESEKASEEI